MIGAIRAQINQRPWSQVPSVYLGFGVHVFQSILRGNVQKPAAIAKGG